MTLRLSLGCKPANNELWEFTWSKQFPFCDTAYAQSKLSYTDEDSYLVHLQFTPHLSVKIDYRVVVAKPGDRDQ